MDWTPCVNWAFYLSLYVIYILHDVFKTETIYASLRVDGRITDGGKRKLP